MNDNDKKPTLGEMGVTVAKRDGKFTDNPDFQQILDAHEDIYERFCVHLQMLIQDLVDEYVEKGGEPQELIMDSLPKAYGASAVAMLFKTSVPESLYGSLLSQMSMGMVRAMTVIFQEIKQGGGLDALKSRAEAAEVKEDLTTEKDPTNGQN